MGRNPIGALALALACVLVASVDDAHAAGLGEPGGPPVTVQMTEEGPVFATLAGRTLYSTARDDTTPGKTQCTNKRYDTYRTATSHVLPVPAVALRRTCVDKWFPLIADASAAPEAPWSLVTRDDGSKQWAYERRAVYSSLKDSRPGDLNAFTLDRFGIGGDWDPLFAPLGFPPPLKLVRRPEGLVLATAEGRPLFVRRGLQRVCSGCAGDLLPVRAPELAEARGDWSLVDSGRQYAFRGQPLYVAHPGSEDPGVAPSGWALAVYRPAAGRPSDISTRFNVLGEIYTTREGKGLYVFTCSSQSPDGLSCDDPGDAAAYWQVSCGPPVDCARNWRLFRAPPNARPVGEWTVVDVAVPMYSDPAGLTYRPGEGPATVKAWAWRGRPLYTFAEDEVPGQVLAHGFNNIGGGGWSAIIVRGTEIAR